MSLFFRAKACNISVSNNIGNKYTNIFKNDAKENDENLLKGLDISQLSKSEKNWFFKPKNDGTPSEEPAEILNLIKKYSGYYLGDTS